MSLRATLCFLFVALSTTSLWSDSAAALEVGFASVDITPEVGGSKPVWIAGYGQNRRAESVHDPLYIRAVVLRNGEQRVAIAVADLVGLQYPIVKAVREKLEEFTYVTIASSHNHEGPDVVGIWGQSPFQSGVDRKYMEMVEESLVQVIRDADAAAKPATAEYGTAQDDTLLRDSRLPKVYDGILRVVKFMPTEGDKPLGVVAQWNCHPECLGGSNPHISADFPYATVARIQKENDDCPVVLITGAVGGLMAPPRENRIANEKGEYPGEGTFEFTELYGQAVGDLANEALKQCSPIELTPFTISAKPITAPLENKLYQVARMAGLMKRNGRVWTGDSEELGEILSAKNKNAAPALETEVAYLRLGELGVACIPGELYPELVYGKVQEPVDPGADFPDAPVEPSIVELVPEDRFLMIGLANDEIGYIIPRRQWDAVAPFAYGRDSDQYGEENSVGSEIAPIIMEALRKRVAEVTP